MSHTDFNDPLPSTLAEPALTPDEQAEADHEDQLLAEEMRHAGVAADTTTYAAEEQLRESERRVTVDVIEGLKKLETGDPVTWTIYRVDSEEPGKLGFLADWSTARLSQARIRDDFGAGIYRIEGHLPNGRYVKRRTVSIAEDAPRRVRESMNANASPGFNMQEFLAHQDATENRRQQREEDRRAREEATAERQRKERMDMILALAGPVCGMMGAIFGGRQDNTAALVAALKPPDPLTMLTQLKALQGSGQDNVLNRVLPMLIDMAGSKAAGGDTGWLDVIKEFAKGAGPAIGSAIEAQMAAARAQIPPPNGIGSAPNAGLLTNPTPPATVSAPNPLIAHSPSIVVPESVTRRERRTRSVPDRSLAGSKDLSSGARGESVSTAGLSSQPSVTGGQVEMNFLTLMPYLPWLRDVLARMHVAAVRARDPEVYAALFLEELPDGVDPNVVGQLLASDDWAHKLTQIDPRWNQSEELMAWLTLARNLILQSLQSEQQAHFAQHSPPTTTQDRRAAVKVDVRGPAADSGAFSVSDQISDARPAPARKPEGVIDRPTKLPSLTGD